MLDRLSTQVFLVSIGVAVVAAVLTGALVRNRTVDAFEQAVERDLATDSAIYGSVSQFPFMYNSWADARFEVDLLSNEFDERIAITELDGTTVLIDSDPGADLPDEAVTVLVSDPFETVYSENVLSVCFSLVTSVDILPGSAIGDEGFIDDGLNASEVDLSQDTEDRFNDCLLENQVDPRANALLYLGYPTDSVDLGSLSLGSLLWGGGGVLTFAGLGAVLLARRVSEPVAELTHAAGQLKAGDLSQRVTSRGGGEIAILAASFNDMACRLQEIDESRQRLISDVAHELRNPIGVLQGNLEAAQDGVLPLDDEMVANLVSETRHLGQLIRDLQDINLAEHQGMRIQRAPLDLFGVGSDVAATYGAISPNHVVSCRGRSAIASADAVRTRQVVENLVKNALANTEAGGTVDVLVEDRGGRVELAVSDTGTGITAEDLPHVFDRFWRADSSRTRATGGTGLGLSICRAIVEAHGGELTVNSEFGVGTTFIVSLPPASVASAESRVASIGR